ncbi:FecR family protein [Leptospira haakeii]|uniref:Iron dicitrate transport regulator FecR n=1 Tax=Leptospira haakeii TaxID=2023198 RepID=A0ABX4PKH3_9LEPT|nr:FecR family protein [Leptospira haakeii]PKA16284.1 iron dicitrate transport regulator FecR [Leptospira haakeii]PKA19834.1 iron dicitrate transport regulator FecR [Leptospira haakeii]
MKNRALVFAFIIFSTLISLPSSLFAEEEIAIVLFIVGEVSGTQDGKKVSLKKNSILKKQDELETKEGKVDLQIGPSVVVRVAAFTKVKIAELSSDKKSNKSKLELVSGKVFARVDKGSKKEDFTIIAPSYNAGVRGTQFVVCEENEVQRKENPDHEDSDVPNGIFVKEGEVGVTTENGKNFPLKRDEEAVVSPQGLLKQPLEEFMREKMKILDGFKKIMEENYKILRDQKLQNQELLNQTKQDI